MKVFVDGKEIAVKNDIRVVYEGVWADVDDFTDEEMIGDLHVILNYEGMIQDLIDEDEEIVRTHAEEVESMAMNL
jgi:hypothetical protein